MVRWQARVTRTMMRGYTAVGIGCRTVRNTTVMRSYRVRATMMTGTMMTRLFMLLW